MSFSYNKLFNLENIWYIAYPPETRFFKDKYIHCRWMKSFVYLRNLATSTSRYPVSLGVNNYGSVKWFVALVHKYHYENTPIQIYR